VKFKHTLKSFFPSAPLLFNQRIFWTWEYYKRIIWIKGFFQLLCFEFYFIFYIGYLYYAILWWASPPKYCVCEPSNSFIVNSVLWLVSININNAYFVIFFKYMLCNS
jgi:hypothetical protein